jgi:hypothetical protein
MNRVQEFGSRGKEYLTNLDLKTKYQNMKGRVRLPDVENRFLVNARTSSDEPIRSNDGLALPTEKLFTVLVGLYKIYLVVAVIGIILTAIVFVAASVMMIDDDRSEIRDVAPIAVPILALILAVMVVHNIISWTGILTFRLRYMWADLWLHCLSLAAVLVYVFLSVDAGGVVLLVVSAILVVLVYSLIHEIRAANPGQA